MSVALSASATLFAIAHKDLVMRRGKFLQADRTYLVECQDVMHAWFVAFQVAVRFPLTSAVLNFDIDIGKGTKEPLLMQQRRRRCERERGRPTSATPYDSSQHLDAAVLH